MNFGKQKHAQKLERKRQNMGRLHIFYGPIYRKSPGKWLRGLSTFGMDTYEWKMILNIDSNHSPTVPFQRQSVLLWDFSPRGPGQSKQGSIGSQNTVSAEH